MADERRRPVLVQVTDELAAHLAADGLFVPCLRPDCPGSAIPPDGEWSVQLKNGEGECAMPPTESVTGTLTGPYGRREGHPV